MANIDSVILDFSDAFNRVINNKDACVDIALTHPDVGGPASWCSASHDCLSLSYRDAGPRIADNS